MKTLQDWFVEYAESHQNKTNQLIHYFCVPAIFFSIVGFLMCIPNQFVRNIFQAESNIIANWAMIACFLILLFYIRLSLRISGLFFVFALTCVIVNYLISLVAPLWIVSLVIFIVAWIGQFIGHHIEGKKPSFFKDLQFLLIGPAWVLAKLTRFKV